MIYTQTLTTVFKRMSYLCAHYVTADVYVITAETFSFRP